MSIIENKDRVGRFTNSQVYKLIPKGKVKMNAEELVIFKAANPKSKATLREGGFGATGLTYIEEKKLERRLGRSLDMGGYSQAAAWGIFGESVLFELLGLAYRMASQETVLHPDKELSKYWGGSVDLKVPNVKVGEIKCYQPKNFGYFADCLMKKDIQLFKKDFPAEYWQIVGNSIIHNVDLGESLLYMPYESEIPTIRAMAEDYIATASDGWKYRFINEKPLSELPYLPDNGYYSNIVSFEFEVPKEDKEYLTSRIEEAIILLNE